MREFLNYQQVYAFLVDVFTEARNACYVLHDTYEDFIEDEARRNAENIISDMDKYIHLPDKTIYGNFNKIDRDWNSKHEQSFDDMVKSVDDETISEQELDYVQNWCFDWFLDTFGTYGLKYNFTNTICEFEADYEEEEENE